MTLNRVYKISVYEVFALVDKDPSFEACYYSCNATFSLISLNCGQTGPKVPQWHQQHNNFFFKKIFSENKLLIAFNCVDFAPAQGHCSCLQGSFDPLLNVHFITTVRAKSWRIKVWEEATAMNDNRLACTTVKYSYSFPAPSTFDCTALAMKLPGQSQ